MRWFRAGSAKGERLVLPASVAGEISRHLHAAMPNEGCGLLARMPGRIGRAEAGWRFFPGENMDASPTRYTMNPADVMQALEEIDRNGLALLAIVHSHPDGPATPSATDLREFHYPGTLMLIADLSGPHDILRAWRVDPFTGRVSEIAVMVEQ